MHLARQNKVAIIKAIGDVTTVEVLFTGKIVDVSCDMSKSYTVGRCIIAPLAVVETEDQDTKLQTESRELVTTFQNEYLIAYHETSAREEKEVLCIVPDLISILGSNGEALRQSGPALWLAGQSHCDDSAYSVDARQRSSSSGRS